MQNHARLPTPGESAPQLAIDAVGLAKSFGGQHALTGLDLAVPEGSVTALIGPNGSGKTTTIRILSTLLAPDAGRATVFGHDVVAEPEAVRAAIGVTGQFSAVDKFLTGRENLALMAGLHHLRRAVALERTASKPGALRVDRGSGSTCDLLLGRYAPSSRSCDDPHGRAPDRLPGRANDWP